jgi:D-alanyl-D-alanine carboxypeptidase
MSTSRPTRRSASAKRETVGGSKGGGNAQAIFVGAVVAVVLSFVVLIAVAADAFSGDDKPNPIAPGDTATPTEEATETATGTAPTTEPTTQGGAPTAAPTAATTAAGDDKIVLACGDILVPLDKDHRLTSDCAPSDLQTVPGGMLMRADAAAALAEMFAAARQEKGYEFYVNSGYRSYQTQVETYNYWVRNSGQAQADRSSARPGHSEHQLGTTADVGFGSCQLECLSGTPQAAWIAENSYKYGFIVSYPDGKEHITGYMPEPWHIRYVGKDTARQVKDSGLTLHEFLLK